jgi:hypothetical protein
MPESEESDKEVKNMHVYEELKEMLCKELEEITRKGELTAGSLETVDKLTHSIKSIETIMAMNEYNEDYSYENGTNDNMSTRNYRDGRYYAGNGSMSYARGRGRNAPRDSMGRYTSRGGYSNNYSYDDAKMDMVEQIRDIMQDAPDEQTKKEFQRFVSKLENM